MVWSRIRIHRKKYEFEVRVFRYRPAHIQEGTSIPEHPKIQPEKWFDLPTILLIIGVLAAAGSVALTFGTESRWIGHAMTSTVGLLLMVSVILTGMVQKGRIRTTRLHATFRYHKMASTWFTLFVIATFILGLLTTMEHGEPLLESAHGLVGLILAVLAIVQLIPSLVIKKRARIQLLHTITGYSIIPLYILQMILGIFAAEIVLL